MKPKLKPTVFRSRWSRLDRFSKIAITIGLAGGLFALLASAFVWLTRGQFALVTIAAAIWALQWTYRCFRQKQPPDETANQWAEILE